MRSYQNACPRNLHPPRNNFRIILPRKFRELRALAIACWYFPDWLKFEIILQLSVDNIFSLDWKNKGLELSLELSLLSSSEQLMLSYLNCYINRRELFGTILQEDLQRALSEIKIIPEKNGPVVRPIRRKGYKDKGTWRPPHRWLPTDGFLLRKEQEEKEKKKLLFTLLLTILRHKLLARK